MTFGDSSNDDSPHSRVRDGQKIGVEIAPDPPAARRISSEGFPGPPLYKCEFFSRNVALASARKLYFKKYIAGVILTTLFIFTIFSIFWGAFYRTPASALPGWIIDFDGGFVGQNVVAGLTARDLPPGISWTALPAGQFPGGVDEVSRAVAEHKIWVAVTVNPGASDRLTAALTSPNAAYDGSQAISAFAMEARNENAFRVVLRPTIEPTLSTISARFASQLAQTLSNSPVVPQLLANSPQTVTAPISFQLVNLHPFDQPLANVVTFTGLIFMLILAFFVAMMGNSAREATKLRSLLKFRSLMILRFSSSVTAYFLLSLFYSLLGLAFKLDVSRKFGHSGFLVFWMLNFVFMCAVGLAIEAMLSLLTAKFVPFFLLTWIMVNVAINIYPIEILPIFYRYGYAAPFYNISRAVRTILFSTKNEVGFHFGVLIIWSVISCVTTILFQFLERRRDIAATKREQEIEQGKAES